MCADTVSGCPSDHTKKESRTQSFLLPSFVQAEMDAPVRPAATAQKWAAPPAEGHSGRQKRSAPLTHHHPKHWSLSGRDRTEAHQAPRQASKTAAAWDWPGSEGGRVCSTPLFCLLLWAPQCHDGPKWPPQHTQMDNYLKQGRKITFQSQHLQRNIQYKLISLSQAQSLEQRPHTGHAGEPCGIALSGCIVPALAQSAISSVKCGT